MSSFNRKKINVDPEGKWKLYCPVLPEGAEPLGTAKVGEKEGALIRFKATGLYAIAAAGAITNIDGRKVAAALTGRGREKEMEGGRKVNVYLDAESVEKARALGDGNISEGIRMAIRSCDG